MIVIKCNYKWINLYAMKSWTTESNGTKYNVKFWDGKASYPKSFDTYDERAEFLEMLESTYAIQRIDINNKVTAIG